MQPILDEATQADRDDELWEVVENDEFKSKPKMLALSKVQALDLLKRAFRAAAERETSLGDGVDVLIFSSSKNSPTIECRHIALHSQ